MGNKLTICHWNNGGSWEAIEVSTSALSGHENHSTDIWPPVEDVTNGNNWPRGEAVYLNACAIAVVTPSPEPTPSPTSSLPDTGTSMGMGVGVLAAMLIAAGAALVKKGLIERHHQRQARRKKRKGLE